MKKRLLVITILICLLMQTMTAYSARLVILYEDVKEKVLAEGVTEYDYKILSTAGWIDFNVVKADLTNNKIKFEPVFSDKKPNVLTTVKNLAVENNAIATVNGDFFSWSNNRGKGSPVGLLIKDGEVLSSAANNNQMSSVIQFNDNTSKITYPTSMCRIEAPDGEAMIIEYVNKYSDLSNPVILNNKFMDKSYGAGNGIVEVVVENDTVKEIRHEGEPVVLKDNMYVISYLWDRSSFMTDHFQEGDSVKLTVEFSEPLEDIKHAIGAGTQLVAQGMPTKITHPVPGKHPRTAAGFDKSGNILYLITVDGRGESNGISLEALQEFMIYIGVYDGVNFDGGGSTAMVVRELGDKNFKTANVPSENRAVINGLAVLPTGRTDILSGIKLKADKERLFVGGKLNLTLLGYDDYYNPMDVNINDISLSVSGITGNFNGLSFIPTSYGDGKIIAKYKNSVSEVNIKVLDYPVEIKVSPKYLNLWDTYDVKVTGYDENGYLAPIDFSDTSISINEDIAVRDNNRLKKTGKGTFEMQVSYGYGSDFMVISTTGDSLMYKVSDKVKKEDILKVTDKNAKSFTVSGMLDYADSESVLPIRDIGAGMLNESGKHLFAGSNVSFDNLYNIGGNNIISQGFGSQSDDCVTYIWIDNKNGGIYGTDKHQWIHFQRELKNTAKNNIVILLSKDIYNGGASGTREINAFFDVIEKNVINKGKNCFVFAGGNEFSAKAENKVRYFTLENLNNLENSKVRTFVKVFPEKDKMTYTLKKIMK